MTSAQLIGQVHNEKVQLIKMLRFFDLKIIKHYLLLNLEWIIILLMKSIKPTVVSLFSGAGGMDLGFIQAGFEIVWANDFFKEAVESYRKNIGEHIVFGDITKIDSSEIPDDPDIIIGGFPCQGFSVANNNRSMQDKRNFLYSKHTPFFSRNPNPISNQELHVPKPV